ncbi:MAG: flagellar motor protein MotB [Gammaproteobacteria bacterium]|nr:flagellar motor protein MotB [Gammaproteobacteria bacterium]
MSAPGDGATQPIIIKRKKVVAHGHHGGAWKVAFADFVTAMMAFFLLLWLLASTTPEERNAIQGYFQDPSGSLAGQGGGLDAPGANLIGPGGADSGVIDMNNPLTQPERSQVPPSDSPNLSQASDAELAREQAEREQRSLDKLEHELSAELEKDDSAFMKLRDQILIDRTALGLRIQIVDKENRPMFDRGQAELQVYAEEVLRALAPRLDVVPNKLSINGHTDSVAYGPGADYTNWELSADRANSARRALLDGGYPDAKVLTVQGMGASIPRLVDDPQDAGNRRIVILVLKKEIEEALRGNSIETTSPQAIIDSPATDPFAAGP